MTPPFNRRELLKLAGAGVFAVGGLSTEAGAQSEESEVIETDLVRVTVPTTAGGSQIFVEELAREGDLYAQNVSPALRDRTENTLNSTEVFSVFPVSSRSAGLILRTYISPLRASFSTKV